MTTRRHEAALQELVPLAQKRLKEGEQRYGSADEWVEGGDSLKYCADRIAGYLHVIARKPDADADGLLADCLNHLLAIKAQRDLMKERQAQAGISSETG